MSTEFFNDQWRIPSNENQNKISNYSMDFDGTSTNIGLGSSVLFDSTKGFSFSAWVNLDSYSPAFPNIVRLFTNQSDDFILGLSNQSGYTGVFFGSPSQFVKGRTTGDISGDFIGVWKHICLTFNGVDTTLLSNYKIYVDGSSIALVGASAFGVGTSLNAIGDGGSSVRHFNGKIDQVSIFDYELPATGTNSVATLYGGGTAVTNPMALSPKPIAAYQLGDQSVDNGANYLVPNNSLQDYVFDFDGTNDSIQIPTSYNLEITGNMTISAWIKSSSSSTGSTKIINKRNASSSNFDFFLDTGGTRLKFYDGTDNIASDISITLGVWNHVAITIQSGVTNGSVFYVNGVAQATNLPTFTIASNTAPLVVGASFGRNSAFFNGEISNVSIFNSSLSASNIITLYNNGSPAADISSLSPVGWWKLNAKDTFDGTNWTIKDYAGSSDGTSSGMTSANLVQSDLQHTSGFSPYALDFDGINDYLDFNNASGNIMSNKNAISISGWFKLNNNATSTVFSCWNGTPVQYLLRYNSGQGVQWYLNSNSTSTIITTNYFVNVGDWVHVVGVKDPITNGGQSRVYINGIEYTSNNTNLSTPLTSISFQDKIGAFNTNNSNPMNGSISNVAYWTNTSLTQVQVTEIYNQGVPSNLNNFSGTAPDHWLQIGSNSSFNTDWTCLDEIGTNNAISEGGMTNNDIVNGVGYSANGLGNSSIDILGDAPYSTANGLSENMDVLDRTTDVPS